jgi:hypothetical protein
MRAAPRDKILSDDEWAQVAGDVMNRTGLSRYGRVSRTRPGLPSAELAWRATWRQGARDRADEAVTRVQSGFPSGISERLH